MTSDSIAAAKWRHICIMAGYDAEQAADLTPAIIAQALKSHGYKTTHSCTGNGCGWCDCPPDSEY